ncbi:helix-turn-helix domain-containing protein [Solicola gregarius]|nr:helix-turn-helix transcriptional regulator [Solicola gregarius]
MLRELLGDVLRRKRSERGRTLRDVADEARVSLAYISEVERGQKEASSEILGAVCRALDVTMLELVSEAHHELAIGGAASVPATGGAALALAA